MFSWAEKVQPAPEAPAQMDLNAEYSNWQAAKPIGGSGSFIYSPQYRAAVMGQHAPKAGIYETRSVRTLDDYASATVRSKYEQQPNESDINFTSRLKPLLQHLAEKLPPAELERVAASYNAAIGRLEAGVQTYEQLREQLDARNSGTGIGIINLSPQERAVLIGAHGGRRVESQASLVSSVESLAANRPMSAAEVNQIIAAREAAQRGQIPQRTQAPTGSSGTGFVGVSNG